METKSHLSPVCHLLAWSGYRVILLFPKIRDGGTAHFIKTAQKLREVQRKDRRQKEAAWGGYREEPSPLS